VDYFQIGHWAVKPVSTGGTYEEFSPSTSLRDHLRIATTSEDALLLEKLVVARKRIEARTLRSCFKRQFDLVFDSFPNDMSPIRLPRLPLVSIDSVTWFDWSGNAHVLSSSGYFMDDYSEPGRLCLRYGTNWPFWPLGARPQLAGIVRFTAGYSTTPESGIPDPLVEAIRKLATELYENREAVAIGNSVIEALPFGYEDMLSEFVLPEVG
jgi:uncharacterized phiE125 gp8 family phage protein